MGFIKGFKNGMQNFGKSIVTIINTILLLLVYILGVGLTALFAKITGKKFLETELKKGSYWTSLNLKKKKTEDYYRQF